ncbi:chlorohydrolase family protein [Amycolatopsis sp.]|uniref:chlorohydrolase family protein n=1 Tax=Amycolatopsis sp. TaxID=37632 RepID=UPI002B5D3747|nr:chlorohydrolase family protein [Amycolatopsis sp.]HVV13660.1 chlorohydrolase family protein [Amycolatopsis sp.]
MRLRAEWVLAYRDGDHVLLHDGEVVVEGDRIVSAGPATGAPATDLGTALLMPGLIDLDALADIDHAIYDSFGASELDWSQHHFRYGRFDVLSRQDKAFVRRYAFTQLLLHGVTTAMPIAAETHSRWAETFDETVDMAAAARELGLRTYLGPSYRSGVNVVLDDGTPAVLWDEAEGEAGFADAVRFARWAREQADPLLRPVFLPCRIETVTEEILKATAAAAAELNVPVRLHCLQGLGERAKLGESPLAVLRRTGLLGERLLIPHGIYVDSHSRVATGRDDVAALAAAGVSIVHCPLTSARYGSALESFGRYRAAGVNLTLGTDSFPPDLVRGMDYGVNMAKVVDHRLDAASPADYVRAATLNAARALGREDLGRIAPGAQADLVAFPLDDICDGVLDDPVRTLLYNRNARHPRLTMVAGHTVVRDGELTGFDVASARTRAAEILRRLKEGYPTRDRRRRPVTEIFPPEFPVVATP